jgi:pyruvate dehydrogenase E1 component
MAVLAAFHAVTDDRLTCFIAYTIKGYGPPFAGHWDNHAGLMNRTSGVVSVRYGGRQEPNVFCSPGRRAGGGACVLAQSAAGRGPVRAGTMPCGCPRICWCRAGSRLSTRSSRNARGYRSWRWEFAERIVTTSPDVTVSTIRALGQPPRDLRPSERTDTFARKMWSPRNAGRFAAARAAHRTRHRREQSLLAARVPPSAGRSSAPDCCRSARSTIPLTNAGRTHSTTPATRMHALSGGHSFGDYARSEGGPSIRGGVVRLAQPGLTSFEPAWCGRAGDLAALGLGGDPARGRRIGLSPAVDPPDRQRRPIDHGLAEAIVAGPTGCEPGQVQRSRSPIGRCRPRSVGGASGGGRRLPETGLLAILARPPAQRLASGPHSGQPAWPSAFNGCAPAPRSSPSATVTRPPYRGSVLCAT